jgi:hypothetical protein
MAVAYDVGDEGNIHPKDKMDVGLRLALAARHVAYGKNIVYSGPIYNKIEVTGDKVQADFTQIGGGLIIGTAPWVPHGATALPDKSLVALPLPERMVDLCLPMQRLRVISIIKKACPLRYSAATKVPKHLLSPWPLRLLPQSERHLHPLRNKMSGL